MATLSQLISQRAAAGARYTAAITELHAALVDLAALDGTLNNTTIAAPGSQPAPTFNNPPDNLPWQFCHPVYAPNKPLPNWRDEIVVARAVYMAGFTGS